MYMCIEETVIIMPLLHALMIILPCSRLIFFVLCHKLQLQFIKLMFQLSLFFSHLHASRMIDFFSMTL